MTDHWGVGRAIFGGKTVEVPCTVEIERTADYFFANAIPEGIELRPGDRVLVHGAPDRVAFGEKRTVTTTATVSRASWPRRLLVRVLGTSHVTDLYEVGFEG